MTMKKKTDFDIAEHVEYDPLTGQFRKVEKKTQPEESPFWTKMGQPKKQHPKRHRLMKLLKQTQAQQVKRHPQTMNLVPRRA